MKKIIDFKKKKAKVELREESLTLKFEFRGDLIFDEEYLDRLFKRIEKAIKKTKPKKIPCPDCGKIVPRWAAECLSCGCVWD